MKLIAFVTATILGVVNLPAQQTPTKEQQIAAATLPLPEAYRAGAAVQIISADRKTTELRKGSNSMVCDIHSPDSEIFAVHCFEKDYEAVLLRQAELGQQLVRNGKPPDMATVTTALRKEIESGHVKLPARPAIGFQMRGPAKAFDWNTNTPSPEIQRWEMVMIPNATGASLSLPSSKPDNGGPWVMAEGTPLAHIMIEH